MKKRRDAEEIGETLMEEISAYGRRNVSFDNEVFTGLELSTVEAAKKHFLSVLPARMFPETCSIKLDFQMARLLPVESEHQLYLEDKLSNLEKMRIGFVEALAESVADYKFSERVVISVGLLLDPVHEHILRNKLESRHEQVGLILPSHDGNLNAVLVGLKSEQTTQAIALARSFIETKKGWCDEIIAIGKTLIHDFRLEQEKRLYPHVDINVILEIYELVKKSQQEHSGEDEDDIGRVFLEFYGFCRFRKEDFKSVNQWNEFNQDLTEAKLRSAYWAEEDDQFNTLLAKLCGKSKAWADFNIKIQNCETHRDPVDTLLALAREVRTLGRENTRLKQQLQDQPAVAALQASKKRSVSGESESADPKEETVQPSQSGVKKGKF